LITPPTASPPPLNSPKRPTHGFADISASPACEQPSSFAASLAFRSRNNRRRRRASRRRGCSAVQLQQSRNLSKRPHRMPHALRRNCAARACKHVASRSSSIPARSKSRTTKAARPTNCRSRATTRRNSYAMPPVGYARNSVPASATSRLAYSSQI